MTQWWRGGVIYQVYPRSFQDSNGDGIGDLPGIIARLDHIASLGVDCIWLSPITKSPQHDMGYDVSDYCEIDPLFGSLEDFDTLLAQAHARGLKVIMDQVVSHTSDQHAWFKESRLSRTNARADWYVWADPLPDGAPPNNWPAVFGGSAWEWNGTRRQYYLHNFLISQPDLNFHNPAVQDAVLDIMRFWLERGVDGFRLDTVNYYFHDQQLRSNPANPLDETLPLATSPYEMQVHEFSKSQPENLDFLRRVRALLDQFPGTSSVGEVGDSHRSVELMAQYTSGGDTLHMCYGFDFLGHEFTAHHFRSRIERFFAMGPDGWPCWSFSNHDVPRHVSRWAEFSRDPRHLAHQTAALVLSLRGSVCLYQGEELGLPETELLFEELTDPRGIRFWPQDPGRDGCRSSRRNRPSTWPASRPIPLRPWPFTAPSWPGAKPTRLWRWAISPSLTSPSPSWPSAAPPRPAPCWPCSISRPTSTPLPLPACMRAPASSPFPNAPACPMVSCSWAPMAMPSSPSMSQAPPPLPIWVSCHQAPRLTPASSPRCSAPLAPAGCGAYWTRR